MATEFAKRLVEVMTLRMAGDGNLNSPPLHAKKIENDIDSSVDRNDLPTREVSRKWSA